MRFIACVFTHISNFFVQLKVSKTTFILIINKNLSHKKLQMFHVKVTIVTVQLVMQWTCMKKHVT